MRSNSKRGPFWLESRLADHRLHLVPDIERLPDGGGDSVTAMVGNSPSLIVEGDVIAALYCRPGGIGPSLVADDHFLYIYFVQEPAMRIFSPDGRAQPTPSTYCSFQRFKAPPACPSEESCARRPRVSSQDLHAEGFSCIDNYHA